MATISTANRTHANAEHPRMPNSALAITPSDTDVFASGVHVYVGVTGDVAVRPVGGQAAVIFKNVPAGAVLPVQVIGVNATNTTASSLVAVF